MGAVKGSRDNGHVTTLNFSLQTAGDNYRRVVELIQKKAIGTVQEVHVWVSGGFGGKTRPTDTPPVPETLHYDLWLGPVEPRPYHPSYIPFNWRH